jgi:hypothetical protein
MTQSYIKRYLDNLKAEGIKRPLLSGSPEAFNLANHGELSTSEYLEYTHYLKNNKVTTAGNFPSVNPTKENYSKLLKIVEELELDLGDDLNSED